MSHTHTHTTQLTHTHNTTYTHTHTHTHTTCRQSCVHHVKEERLLHGGLVLDKVDCVVSEDLFTHEVEVQTGRGMEEVRVQAKKTRGNGRQEIEGRVEGFKIPRNCY